MSADADKDTACPSAENAVNKDVADDTCDDEICAKKRKKPPRKVCFPDDNRIVTAYFEPANPWHDVPTTSRSQLAAEYLDACRRHDTPPIDAVLEQIRDLPENSLGGGNRAPRLLLSGSMLMGAKAADALEALLRRAQFIRIELQYCDLDDEGAEALFDMMEYYESAQVICITGPRMYGIRGWQACSRMIKKSAELQEIDVSESPLEANHAPVLARALRPLTCRLRALCLQHASLTGEPLLCLVIALKSNSCIRELRLGDNGLSANDAAQLGNLLRANTRIQHLDLSNNNIQDAGVGHLADALVFQASQTPPSAATSPVSPHCCVLGGFEARGLAFLVLWNNQLTRNCAHHLARALRASQSLRMLNIGRNSVGAGALGSLVDARLHSLGLQSAKLSAECAPAALAALIANTQLRRLDLRDNKLSVAGLQAICSAMKDNTTMLQIDLDDPVDSPHLSENSEAAPVSRLTRSVRALCARNTPAHCTSTQRKLSLTCAPHPPTVPRAVEEDRKVRLRSPAPSPAGSPLPPHTQHSRFSVTRVTPERDSSTDSSSPSTPTRPSHCSTPSRFRVVQVAELPQIQVTSSSEQRSRPPSRFSVTRNFDSSYNQFTPPPTPDINKSKVEVPTCEGKNCESETKAETDSSIKIHVISDVKSKETYSDIVKCEKSDVSLNNKTESDKKLETDSKLVLNCTQVSDIVKVDVNLKDVESSCINKSAKVHTDQMCDDKTDNLIKDVSNIDIDSAMSKIEAINEDFGHLIDEMKDYSLKNVKKEVRSDCTQTDSVDSKLDTFNDVPVHFIRDNVVLKKNKSESSLDSPDLEVSRLMNKKVVGSPFCDSSSSLEISGSSMESLNLDNQPNSMSKPILIHVSVESDTELDRRKYDQVTLSTESSIESNTSETTPVNSGNFLNMSVSSNESVSPIIFGKNQKIHGSLSSLEASVSSMDSARQEKLMLTSADSGIEYSLQNPSDCKDNLSHEGTLTSSSSLKETVNKSETCQLQDTLTSSPKRASSLLDVPALKNKGLDRMRKISFVAPSSSFHIPKPEPEKLESKYLEKLLSIFQNPGSLFSRQNEEEKKSTSETPPRKDSSLTSSFWPWGSVTDSAEREDRDSLSEATDSTLSERVQVSYVDESFSKKLDSKTPSTDTDNTLSEFQSFPNNSETGQSHAEDIDRVTELTTDDNVVQTLDISVNTDNASSNGNQTRACDMIDLIKPNDLNKNVNNANKPTGGSTDPDVSDDVKPLDVKLDETKLEPIRPRSFASVLKSSGSENTMDKQASPDSGPPVDKIPSKIIRGIKENVSPENTLTSSMTNTKAIALGMIGQPVVNTVWDVTASLIDEHKFKLDTDKVHSDLAPIATIEETCDESADEIQLKYIDDVKETDECDPKYDIVDDSNKIVPTITLDPSASGLECVDLGKDALSYLIYENQDFESHKEHDVVKSEPSLAQELEDAEIKQKLLDLSPELVVDEAAKVPEVFKKEIIGSRTSPVIPERAKLKKSNSMEDLNQILSESSDKDSPKTKTIAFKVPEISGTVPRDIPERRRKLRTRSGSSPKSLPECLNRPCSLSKMDSLLSKKKKKVSSLGKIAKDSLLALNMSEEEIAEFRRSSKLASLESLRSLESVSEDANSQSGTSVDSRCRSCLRMSQESLMSLDSITEDCKCTDDKSAHSAI